jgi:hypothetical protein
LEIQEKEEKILERQVLKVVLVMSSSYIEDLGKLVDKLIIDILFLTTLELNIINRERKKRMQFMWEDISI